jgi:hypothetical protein
MIPSYKPGLEIERIDNNGNYSKENCRWATPMEQSLNRRSNIILEFRGKKLHISRWAETLGIKRQTLEKRYHSGWTTEKILTTAVIRGNPLRQNAI